MATPSASAPSGSAFGAWMRRRADKSARTPKACATPAATSGATAIPMAGRLLGAGPDRPIWARRWFERDGRSTMSSSAAAPIRRPRSRREGRGAGRTLSAGLRHQGQHQRQGPADLPRSRPGGLCRDPHRHGEGRTLVLFCGGSVGGRLDGGQTLVRRLRKSPQSL